MSRTERLRETIVESGSPVANYSLNQSRMKLELEGEHSLHPNVSKKILMAKRRKARNHEEVQQYEASKVKRIADRVRAAFGGYDGVDPVILDREIAYLRQNGVDIQTVLEPFPSGV